MILQKILFENPTKLFQWTLFYKEKLLWQFDSVSIQKWNGLWRFNRLKFDLDSSDYTETKN